EYNHVDPDDGLLIVANGSKQVRLFSCQSIDRLYPNKLGTKGRTVSYDYDDDGSGNDDDGGGRVMVIIVILLYIPAFWWHQITSTETTISINIFWGDAGLNNYSLKVMREPTWCCFRYWLLNIIEQNRSQISFPRILNRLSESLPNFLMTQWHEKLTSSQTNELVEVVVGHLSNDNDACDDDDDCDVRRTVGNAPVLKIRGLLWRK
ncbi:hypothetical protein HELRODRAFT_85380, partial [Helobdella robusta]|uniref:Cupin-like domain-containing protein n=1 Tax=Helobdella robusta TaxID=6412 RepID=T1G5W1_HELRO